VVESGPLEVKLDALSICKNKFLACKEKAEESRWDLKCDGNRGTKALLRTSTFSLSDKLDVKGDDRTFVITGFNFDARDSLSSFICLIDLGRDSLKSSEDSSKSISIIISSISFMIFSFLTIAS